MGGSAGGGGGERLSKRGGRTRGGRRGKRERRRSREIIGQGLQSLLAPVTTSVHLLLPSRTLPLTSVQPKRFA